VTVQPPSIMPTRTSRSVRPSGADMATSVRPEPVVRRFTS
jgi:hypothetical protein